MRLAYVSAEARGATDALLVDLAARLRGEGMRLVGAVQHNVEQQANARCVMNLLLLPDGPEQCISQELGTGAQGCRLDPGALENVAAEVGARLAGGADLLIVNKFGQREAEGRGLAPLIGEAMAAGIPVLVGLKPAMAPAFAEFTGGLGEPLPANLPAVLDWCRAAIG